MPEYVLRNLDPQLWSRFADRGNREGWPMKALFVALMEAYANFPKRWTQRSSDREPRLPNQSGPLTYGSRVNARMVAVPPAAHDPSSS